MRLIQTVVWSFDFRQSSSNQSKLRLLDRLIEATAPQQAAVLALPAGFLTAGALDRVPTLIAEIERRAFLGRIAMIGGIDLEGAPSKRSVNQDEQVRRRQLPYFGFAVGAGIERAPGQYPWRQVSTTCTNAGFVDAADLPAENRIVTIAGKRIAVLVCGELFNDRAKTSIVQPKPDLVVDLGHTGMGCGLIPAMRRVALNGGCPVAHAQHLSDSTGRLHFVAATGEQLSVPACHHPLVSESGFWAGWEARKF